jgi:hypothetical protein
MCIPVIGTDLLCHCIPPLRHSLGRSSRSRCGQTAGHILNTDVRHTGNSSVFTSRVRGVLVLTNHLLAKLPGYQVCVGWLLCRAHGSSVACRSASSFGSASRSLSIARHLLGVGLLKLRRKRVRPQTRTGLSFTLYWLVKSRLAVVTIVARLRVTAPAVARMKVGRPAVRARRRRFFVCARFFPCGSFSFRGVVYSHG